MNESAILLNVNLAYSHSNGIFLVFEKIKELKMTVVFKVSSSNFLGSCTDEKFTPYGMYSGSL